MMEKICFAGAVFLFMALLAAPSVGAPSETTVAEGDIGENTVWDGSYRLESTVMVQEGANLVIRAGSEVIFPPGTRLFVNGSITVEGTADRPVRFVALPGEKRPAEGGIVLSGKGGENLFRHSHHSGSDWALRALGDSSVRIEKAVFRGNTNAIEVERKGDIFVSDTLFEKNQASFTLSGEWHAEIRACEFREGGGIKIHQGKNVILSGNTFRGVERALEARQVVAMKIEGSLFDGGGEGIVSDRFSDFIITCNTFRGLERAVVIQQISKASLENNLFAGNATAVTMNNRGGGGILSNEFADNATAVFLDLSSYPVINNNAFEGNSLDIDLGKFMSGDWEERHGSKTLSQQVAAWVGSRHLDQIGPALETGGEIDARDNWWGEKTTAEMSRVGPEGDIKGIDDYFDMHETTYREYGEETFRIDRVVYSPWKAVPDRKTGPGAERCAPPPADRLQ